MLLVALAAQLLAVGCGVGPAPVERGAETGHPTPPATALALEQEVPGARVEAPPPSAPKAPGTVADAPPADHSAALEELVLGLSPTLRQRLSDALYVYANATPFPEETARAVIGPTRAAVRIVFWGDIRCRQCALLHDTLGYVRSQAPPASMSLELRQYPLDGYCNPHLEKREEHSLHCTTAKMMICAEGSGHELDLLTAFYRNQASLPRELAMEMTAAFIGWDRLTACLNDPALEAKLRADTDYAAHVQVEVLPFVLLNGRRAPAFGPFLYAMCLSGGRTDHPALAALPPPNPKADFALTD